MKCPVCKDVTLLMADKKWIEIDYCPECRWVWLDRWELEKLISAEKTYDNTEENYSRNDNYAPRYENKHDWDSYSSQKHHWHKKKSFLENFDFFD
ncbi:MAG: hypothetical protein ACD_2C00014G0003 [uncultured bacterium (gcode 4)]|uniref:Transcription factor zinc-finger domain-containing protein n=1 Tax=uncultured bacterium (gcode 4) TaxID=1234023 RepID=K2GIK8_9BACT|nr:MAG: hypothetical protein ACD_2C00014G0003 [uncultured bacterium (gcode 4)]